MLKPNSRSLVAGSAALCALLLGAGFALTAAADTPPAAAPAPAPAAQPLPMPTFAAPIPTPPAAAGDVKAVLSGSIAPLKLHLRELNGDWRTFQAGAIDQGLSALGAYMAVLSGGQNFSALYFTEGRTLDLGGQNYLVAYRLPGKPVDFTALIGAHADYSDALPDLISPDSELTLTLLNLRTVGALDDIRPFSLDSFVIAANSQRARMADALGQRTDMPALNNLRQLATALLQLAQAQTGTIPAIQTPQALKRALGTMISDPGVFLDPASRRPFFANPALAGHRLSEFADPATVVLFYADSPGDDGLRAVVFLDGSSRMVDRSEWQQLQVSQHLP